jgi:large subunit ribosomal protein L18
MEKKVIRLRRAKKTRARIALQKIARLSVHRTNCHIYAQVFSPCGTMVLASASSTEASVRSETKGGATVASAARIGALIAERAKLAGVDTVAFDRSGFHYHGRVKELAEAARVGGLKF